MSLGKWTPTLLGPCLGPISASSVMTSERLADVSWLNHFISLLFGALHGRVSQVSINM